MTSPLQSASGLQLLSALWESLAAQCELPSSLWYTSHNTAIDFCCLQSEETSDLLNVFTESLLLTRPAAVKYSIPQPAANVHIPGVVSIRLLVMEKYLVRIL